MLALDQRVVDFSMIEYTFEVIVTQWRMKEIVMDIEK